MSPEQEMQVRMTLVMKNMDRAELLSLEDIEKMVKFVVGQKSSIIPATAIKVAK